MTNEWTPQPKKKADEIYGCSEGEVIGWSDMESVQNVHCI